MDTPNMISLADVSSQMAGENAQPLKIKAPLIEGSLGSILSKARRLQKQQLHDFHAKENYRPCHKKCKKFKVCECYKKSFAEQKKCFDEGGSK